MKPEQHLSTSVAPSLARAVQGLFHEFERFDNNDGLPVELGKLLVVEVKPELLFDLDRVEHLDSTAHVGGRLDEEVVPPLSTDGQEFRVTEQERVGADYLLDLAADRHRLAQERLGVLDDVADVRVDLEAGRRPLLLSVTRTEVGRVGLDLLGHEH